ncbi:hypothetical protein L1987_32732 [Smallanthus sonchifolius]|uniref:Uncharacterized protein n=1 Tax=Smallanthus sonchifolius TaxID=185202 RepID=A0ACB9HP33_9ASTR|nr:hypothetical protein L1987_32732 [Smallanthus sonchifolius]
MVLKEIIEALHSSSGSASDSPSEITEVNRIPFKSSESYDRLPICNNIHHQCSKFATKVPQKEIVQLYEQLITVLQNLDRDRTTFPSASQLQGRAGFRFHVLPEDQGIRMIDIDDGNNFYLPGVTLNNGSDVMLRNLVAYETLVPHSNRYYLPLTVYMGLMCRLVMNVDDVRLLRKENIIKSDMGDDEVAKIYVGMSSYILSLKTNEKSKLQGMINKANNVYYSRPMVRAYLFLKKLANWLLVVLRPIGSFVGATWKIVAFIISIVTVFMLTYQAYCDVYCCDKTNVTLSSHASS